MYFINILDFAVNIFIDTNNAQGIIPSGIY